MKNKLDTLQMVMLGYLIFIMAAFTFYSRVQLVCKEKTSLSSCNDRMSLGIGSVWLL